MREQLYKILFRPDKNAPEYKAVVEASRRAQKAPLDLLTAAGAIESPYQFHWRRFLFENFPKGTGFPALQAPAIRETLPLAPVQAFSIDDSQTTEIDDALSVQGLGSGTVVFAVHIAAPGLAVAPDSAVDQVARDRLSTVYMPGHKLTMLPDAVVQAYTLVEGRDCPAVSIYFTVDEATLDIRSSETKLDRVPIAANLRHDRLDGIVTDATLSGEAPADYAFAPELAFAFRFARQLKAAREVVRGKPENFNRPDYAFRLHGPTVDDGQPPRGDEHVEITTRARGTALDLIVAEAMILANSTWGGWLDDNGVPGIYRSQASMAPGVKVRMGVRAAPHAGMGVAQYAWATSPLRRYVDLVNQWQIIAVARHGRTAALAAPFKPRDAQLFSIISGFDAAHAAYNGFQSAIERYWALRSLAQDGIARARRHGDEGRPGARRGAAAGLSRRRRRGAAARRPGARSRRRGRPADARPQRHRGGAPRRSHAGRRRAGHRRSRPARGRRRGRSQRRGRRSADAGDRHRRRRAGRRALPNAPPARRPLRTPPDARAAAPAEAAPAAGRAAAAVCRPAARQEAARRSLHHAATGAGGVGGGACRAARRCMWRGRSASTACSAARRWK